MARPLLKPSKAKRERRIAFFKKLLVILAILIFIFSGIVFGLRQPQIRINQIVVTGNESLDKNQIASTTEMAILGNYFWMIPKDSILFYSKREIINSLLSSFTQIGKAKVSMESFHSILVSIEERSPHYSWCGLSVQASENQRKNEKCYFMDEEGFVFAEAPVFSGDVYIKFYGNLIGEGDNVIGKRFLDIKSFDQLDLFVYSIAEIKMAPTKLVEKSDGDYELYLARGGKINFNLKDGVDKPILNLESALDTDPLRKNMAEKRQALQYIDLRFDNKVFFKFD